MQAVALPLSRNYFQSEKLGSICAYAESKKELAFHGEGIKLTFVYYAVDFV